ncbi:LOG family protein [Hippea alviniae]|uniref:LOG family protein n=1 Tax=Hippea alviniae TaxID=1279027 RepID=UPI0003B36D24|nr:LOG family protein [Hippea alviniae]
MKWATTFGASKVNDKKLYEEGVELGKFLVSQGYAVKCGGYQGLMEAVSRGVKEAGGTVVGVGLEYFEKQRPQNPYLTEKIVARTIFERLELLTKDSELFVVQQGSIGTLNELFLVWVFKYSLGMDVRVCLIGKPYLALRNCEFIDKKTLELIEIYETLDEFKVSFN